MPEKVRARAEHKLAKLQRFDDRILAMDVEFSEERNPRVADPHRVEVTLTTKSGLVRAHANATDPSAAVDQVVDRLERQVKKLKGRRVDRTQHADGVKAIPPLPVERARGGGRGHPVGPGRARTALWTTTRLTRPRSCTVALTATPGPTSRNREQPARSQGGPGAHAAAGRPRRDQGVRGESVADDRQRATAGGR